MFEMFNNGAEAGAQLPLRQRRAGVGRPSAVWVSGGGRGWSSDPPPHPAAWRFQPLPSSRASLAALRGEAGRASPALACVAVTAGPCPHRRPVQVSADSPAFPWSRRWEQGHGEAARGRCAPEAGWSPSGQRWGGGGEVPVPGGAPTRSHRTLAANGREELSPWPAVCLSPTRIVLV